MGAGSAFANDLPAAFGAGDLQLTLAGGDAADGLAALADEIFMFLILAALPGDGDAVFDRGPPGQEFRVLRPALGQVPGEGAEQDQDCQDERHRFQRHPNGKIPAKQGLDQPRQQIGDQQRRIQLVGAVAAIHEPGNGSGDPIKEIPHGEAASVSIIFILSIEAKCEQVKNEADLFPCR